MSPIDIVIVYSILGIITFFVWIIIDWYAGDDTTLIEIIRITISSCFWPIIFICFFVVLVCDFEILDIKIIKGRKL